MKKGFASIIILLGIALIILIGGVVVYQKILAPKVNSTSTPTLSPTPTPDTTAEWKNFDSPEMHFQLKYPNTVNVGLSTVNSQQTVSLAYFGKYQGSNTGWVDGITMSITYNLINPPVLDNLKNLINDKIKLFPNTFQPSKDVKIGDFSGYQSDRIDGGGVTDLYLVNGDRAYLLINITVMDSHNLGYQKIADQILSTFKFLD